MSLLDTSSKRRRSFPGEVLMKIIARIPFPAVLKARCLSKAWRSRLSPGSGDWARFQPLFQSLSPVSTLIPVLLQGRSILGYNGVTQSWQKMGMHPSTIPLESFGMAVLLDEHDAASPSHPDVFRDADVLIGGGLICYVVRRRCLTAVHVTDILTGYNEILPVSANPRIEGKTLLDEATIFQVGAHGYKVILVRFVLDEVLHPCSEYRFCLELEIFDSVLREWVMDTEVLFHWDKYTHMVARGSCIDNLLYILFTRQVGGESDTDSISCGDSSSETEEEEDETQYSPIILKEGEEETDTECPETILLFWEYDINKGMRNNFRCLFGEYDIFMDITKKHMAARMVVCDSRLILVTTMTELSPDQNPELAVRSQADLQVLIIRIFEVQLELFGLREVSKSPPLLDMKVPIDTSGEFLRDMTGFSSDDRHIYICFKLDGMVDLHCYNLSEDRWSRLPVPPEGFSHGKSMFWADTTFSTGLNPFLPSRTGKSFSEASISSE